MHVKHGFIDDNSIQTSILVYLKLIRHISARLAKKWKKNTLNFFFEKIRTPVKRKKQNKKKRGDA